MPAPSPTKKTETSNGTTSNLLSNFGSSSGTQDSSGTTSSTTQQSQSSVRDPWAGSVPLLNEIAAKARALGNTPGLFTPTFSDATRSSLDLMEAAARAPQAATGTLGRVAAGSAQGFDQGLGALMQTASGSMLAGNPALDRVLDAASSRTADAVNRQFSGMGRYGSGAHTGVLTDRLGEIEARGRLDDYNRERGAQLGAANTLAGLGGQAGQAATQLDAAALRPAMLMGEAGRQRDAMAAAERAAPLNAVDWQSRLAFPLANVGGSSSGTSTGSSTGATTGSLATTGTNESTGSSTGTTAGTTNSQTQASRDPLAMALGLGMAGAGLMTGNPGMAMGGLGGLFGGNVMSQPGTAANGGWSTSASRAPMFGLF